MAAAGSRHSYIARINRVLDHISAHLDATLDLQTLAGVAHFSPWHFHRLFQAMTGETLADCVRRLRLEAAAQKLLGHPPVPALSVALDVGFGSAEVFTRAFKSHFGVTPSHWRRGAWRDWAATHAHALRKIHQARSKAHQAAVQVLFKDTSIWPAGPVPTTTGVALMQVELRTVPSMRLAYLRHTGPYGDPGISQTWERFGAWCGQNGLVPPRRKMYGISQDDPSITEAARCRYDCCIEVDAAFVPRGEVGVQDFAGGRYACARFTGTGADIHGAWMRMYGQWLPQSGYQADDKPGLEIYEEDFTVDPQTGAFHCLLCVPVRRL